MPPCDLKASQAVITCYTQMNKFWLFAQKANEAMSMGKKWQESILDICDQHFFFTEVCLQPPLFVPEFLHATSSTLQAVLLPPV